MSSHHWRVRVAGDTVVSAGDFAVMIATGNEPSFFGAAPAEGSDPWAGPPSAEMVAHWAGISIYRLHIDMNPKLPRSLEGARRR